MLVILFSSEASTASWRDSISFAVAFLGDTTNLLLTGLNPRSA
jgi:hypothetical protein